MVWSLALRPDDAKQDSVVYGTKFGVVFLVEGPRTASIQKVLVQAASVSVDCRKAECLECFISCIISCHTPVRVVKEDEERRSQPHSTSKHN